MNIAKALVGLFIFVILNTIYIKYFSILDTMPNLMVIAIVLLGLIKGKELGAGYGLFAGLISDILVGTNIGLYGLIYMYIGYGAGVVAKKVNTENIIISAFIVATADICYNLVIYFCYYLTKDYSLITYLIKISFPEALYTAVIFVGMYFVINGLANRVRIFRH